MGEAVVSLKLDKVIHWPDFQTYTRTQALAHNTPQENLERAVALIDQEGEQQLTEAKNLLEGMLSKDPKFDRAYVELARVAMKSNWGPEGLHAADNLLQSALQIRPDSADAKILLGYVYTHQRRFAAAESMFTQAARSETKNTWLWANWGELLTTQGKLDQAISKYRQAIAHPMTHDGYDRARADAYLHLLALLDKRKDLNGMETLYKQRLVEFGPGSCYSADYARFLLQIRGDADGAIDLARRGLDQNCDDSQSRQVLGLAEYVKWSKSADPNHTEALNQARVYLPTGPTALYLLATTDKTLPALKKLLAAGERIDQIDNEKMTALAYALQNRDLAAVKRLLVLGAHSELPVGFLELPVALIPVLSGYVDAIRVLQQFGVDYSKLRYRGATALDMAKQSGNLELLEVLGQESRAL